MYIYSQCLANVRFLDYYFSPSPYFKLMIKSFKIVFSALHDRWPLIKVQCKLKPNQRANEPKVLISLNE